MKIAKILTIAAAAACLSTAAMAGGFTFSSAGGNFGKWAYSDGMGSGTAECKALGSCVTTTLSGAGSSSGIGYHSAGSSSQAGNTSASQGYGIVSAQSESIAVAGSGVGNGAGFKIGGVTIQCGCGH